MLLASWLAIGLFAGMVLALEIGRRVGARRGSAGAEPAGFGVIEGAVFGLLGLMIAFTFSGAASRFDTRRQLIVEETNAIGTAFLRLDLLPADAQPALRERFRRYLDTRLAAYGALPDLAAARRHLADANAQQGEIWRAAVTASADAHAKPGAAMLLLPALNAMFDITTTRTMATRMHPPPILFVVLVGLALASAWLAGYAMGGGRRSWTHVLCFAAVVAVAVYVIIDMEYPRLGYIRVDDFDDALYELRRGM